MPWQCTDERHAYEKCTLGHSAIFVQARKWESSRERTHWAHTHARTHAGQYEEYKKRVALLKESKKEPAKKH